MTAQIDMISIKLSIHVFDEYNKTENISQNYFFKREFADCPDNYKLVTKLYSTPYYGNKCFAGAIYYNETEKTYAIAFRGTKPAFEWFNNLSFKSISTENGMLHSGYKNLYNSFKKDIIECINKICKIDEFEKIIVCGASLGGALSVMTVADLIETFPDIKNKIHLVTFGCPHVVDEKMANHITSNVQYVGTFERATDVVTTSLFGYHPVSSPVILESFGHKFWMYPLCHEINFYHKSLSNFHNIPYDKSSVVKTFKILEKYINP